MMTLRWMICCFCALTMTQAALGEEPLTRIHFGSCVKQTQPMPIFETILEDRPEVFLMIGDNIYADTADMEVMRAKYAQLNADPGFSLLRATCPILATWDDHDFGLNDAGGDYAKKRESQKIFSDFWGDPLSSPRRQRPGVYDAHVIGPEGKRVQIILLDTRYFRGPLQTGERRVGGPYYPNEDPAVPLLGEAQWQWLEEQLKQPAEIRVIASSIQFIAEAAGQETWSNLPSERQRLIDLIAKTGAAGVVFVSGDRHWSDLSVQREEVPYPLYDLTSSSLNQPHKRGTPTENQYRETDQTYHQVNFGVIEIDWNEDGPGLEMRIQDLENQTRIQKRVALSELHPERR
ncbi:MAG: alkaline phosphatase D family protein [Verrucomicrobiales bacterium]|nr:alkaline phosphatase D family protein [Verrucomicrobiales bacterium]